MSAPPSPEKGSTSSSLLYLRGFDSRQGQWCVDECLYRCRTTSWAVTSQDSPTQSVSNRPFPVKHQNEPEDRLCVERRSHTCEQCKSRQDMTQRSSALGTHIHPSASSTSTMEALAGPWRRSAPMLLSARRVDSWRTSAVRSAIQGNLNGDTARLVPRDVILEAWTALEACASAMP
jgi:hypothetical protein